MFKSSYTKFLERENARLHQELGRLQGRLEYLQDCIMKSSALAERTQKETLNVAEIRAEAQRELLEELYADETGPVPPQKTPT